MNLSGSLKASFWNEAERPKGVWGAGWEDWLSGGSQPTLLLSFHGEEEHHRSPNIDQEVSDQEIGE